MKWIFNSCGVYRESVCLLASGVLPDTAKAKAESHLVTCPTCRDYYDEIRSIAGLLTHWEKSLANLEPSQAAQARWGASSPALRAPSGLQVRAPERGLAVRRQRSQGRFMKRGYPLARWFLDWCQDMIWPCRWIWTGLAAVWLVLAAINFSTRAPAPSLAAKSSRPSPEMVRAFWASEGLLTRWPQPAQGRAAEPPKPPLPSPRSQQRPRFFRV